MKKVFIGTSGYTYNHWKGRFYPENLPQNQTFKYYCKNFNTVEINSSFYHSFKKESYKRWRKDSPEDFKFFIKGHRYITGVKRLKEVEDSVEFFFDGVFELKEKLAGVLWQFPPNFKLTEDTEERLKHFLSILPDKILHVFEFRHESWFNNKIYEFLKSNNTAFVLTKIEQDIITADFIYIRFHGPGEIDNLKQWAQKLKNWREKYDIYAYFNNDANANAVKNAKELIELTSM